MGRKRTQEEYDLLLKKENPTIIRIGTYHRMDERLDHKCLVCGHEWKVFPSSLTGKKHSGCPMCNGGTDTVVVGKNDMWTTNPELAKLLADPNDGYKYTQRTRKKVKWKCPTCGKITKPKSISNVYDNGLFCRSCDDNVSLPNRIMYNLLSSIGINFESEVVFDWCKFKIDDKDKYGIYDFYLENKDKKYIVEMDGYFHKYDNYISGQSASDSKIIDDEKDRLALENDIEVIRITCIPSTTTVIKNGIINSKLAEILDLSNINWNKCFYQSIKSVTKEVCVDYKNGITITELSSKYKKDKGTIMKYLDYGTQIGLCKYNHDNNKRHVVCLNDNKYYDMIKDAGVFYNVSTASIQQCCLGKVLNAGNGVDENGLPLVFAYYEDYIKLSDIDILKKIQDSIIFKFYDKMVICLNTRTVFKTTIDAQKWCGSSITANLYEPHKYKFSGKHPLTKEKLSWMKLKDYYLQSTTSFEESA